MTIGGPANDSTLLCSVSDQLSNKVYTLLHKHLQESSINLNFSPGGSAFLVEYLMEV